MRPPRVLPVPTWLERVRSEQRVAFDRGAIAARCGLELESNDYMRAPQRRAYSLGWLAEREGWLDITEI